jgi:hypothetical protein
MKATEQQYEECITIYQMDGASGVYRYADSHGIDSWSNCYACETDTPDMEDGSCLVCGIFKTDELVLDIYA